MILSRHYGSRPAWVCLGCHQPYPCPPARDRLVAYYGGFTPALARAGTAMLDKAAHDRLDATPEQLWQRFVAWTAPTWVAWPMWAA